MSLLAVRVAVLLLIAVGLARPALSSLTTLWGGGRTAAIAIVLDNSASMAVVDGGRPRFETARQAAEQVVARLREGDQVALLPTGGPPGPELGRLFRTHETVRQALDQCRPSYERADLAAKLQQARDLLARADAPSKEIYVLTDNQSLSWEGMKEPNQEDDPKQAKRPTPAPAPVVIVNVDREPAPNVALQSVSLSSPAPVAGVPFQAAALVLNCSTVPQQKHLELQIDGAREAVSPDLSLPPGGTLEYGFRFTLDREGVHRGEVRLVEEDGSALDNRLYFAVSVDQQIPLVIVKARRGKVPDQAGESEIEVVRPSGEVVRVRKADQDADGLRYFDTHEAGVYLVRQVNRKPPKQMAFAVNIDPADSDPATVTRADLQARFGTRPLLFCENPSELAGTIERLREGTSLWEWFLAAVLIALVLEVFLANRGTAAPAAQARPANLTRPQPMEPTLSGPVGAAAGDDVRGFLESLQ